MNNIDYYDWKAVLPKVSISYNSLRNHNVVAWLNKDKTVTFEEPCPGIDLSLLKFNSYFLELRRNDDEIYESTIYDSKWKVIKRIYSEQIVNAIEKIRSLYHEYSTSPDGQHSSSESK